MEPFCPLAPPGQRLDRTSTAVRRSSPKTARLFTNVISKTARSRRIDRAPLP